MIIPVKDENLIKSVAQLASEIWTDHYTPIIGSAQVGYMINQFQSEEAIAKQIDQGYLYFLIEDHHQCAGYFSIHPKEDELFLSKFYVHAGHRGKGLGRGALKFIEGIAVKKGLMKITLTVNKYNHTSIKIYKKLGFKNVASLITDIGSGFMMDDYRLEKKLA